MQATKDSQERNEAHENARTKAAVKKMKEASPERVRYVQQ